MQTPSSKPTPEPFYCAPLYTDVAHLSGRVGLVVPLSYDEQLRILIVEFPELGIDGSPENKLLVDAFNASGRNRDTVLALAHIIFGVRDPFENLTASELRQVLPLATPNERDRLLPMYDRKREQEADARIASAIRSGRLFKGF